jgi:Ricin-type beta-trefoil lectin domain-like
MKSKTPASGRFKKPIAIACVFALTGIAASYYQFHNSDMEVSAQGNPARSASRMDRRNLVDADRLARLIALGGHATPAAAPDPAGPPVPVLTAERSLISSGWQRDPSPALTQFGNWTTSYLAGNESARASLLAEGTKLAAARRAEIFSLIASDPRRALGNAVPLAIRAQLPAEVQALLENRVDAFGDLGTECTIASQGHPEIPERDFVKIDGKDYTAFRYGDREKVRYMKDASIHGIEIGGKIAVLDSPLRQAESGEIPKTQRSLNPCHTKDGVSYQLGDRATLLACSPEHLAQAEDSIRIAENNGVNTGESIASNANWLPSKHNQFAGDSGVAGFTGTLGRPPISHTQGVKKVLVMRATSAQRPISTSISTAFLASQGTDFNNRFQRMSFGKMSLQLTVTPVITIPGNIDKPFNDPTFDRDGWNNYCKTQAAAQGYVLSQYQAFTTILNDTGEGYAGVAAGDFVIMNNNFEPWVFLHEFGHFLSLPHASSWESGDGNPVSPSRTTAGYGDWGCYMGNNPSTHFGRTYNPAYLNKMNWLNDGNIQNINKSGTYTVYQHDGVISLSDATRKRALKLPRDGEFDYWLSICGDTDPSQFGHMSGVAIRAVTSWSGSNTWLVDMNNPTGGSHDAPLALNQTWYDADSDLTLKTVEVGGTTPNRYAKIEVTVGPRNKAATRPLVSGGVYRIKSRENGNFLQVAGNSATNLVTINTGAATNTAAQNWVIWRNTDGTYRINHQGTDKWIDVENNSFANGARVRQATGNTAADSQKWYIRQKPNGALLIMHKGTQSVLDMDRANTNDVNQYEYVDGNWQHWDAELVGISNGTYRVIPRHAQSQSLDMAGGGTNNGAPAQLYHWDNFGGQKFNVSNIGSGRIRLSPVSSTDKALNVIGSSATPGTGLTQQTWANNSAQKWSFSRIDTNWLRFTPDCAPSGCMEVAGDDGAVGDGSVVQLWTFLGAQDQQWRFADSD